MNNNHKTKKPNNTFLSSNDIDNNNVKNDGDDSNDNSLISNE